jgi:hypothetical protein
MCRVLLDRVEPLLKPRHTQLERRRAGRSRDPS